MTRRAALPKTSPELKASLDPTFVSAVDDCLKALRKAGRAIAPIVASHETDSRLLQRIVYKSKNQHKNALFFRKLCEIKRYTTRIEQANLVRLVDDVRASFYADEVASSSKWKNSPWSQYPGAKYLNGFLRRLDDYIRLSHKALDAYTGASVALTRFSQSTAFLPLMLTTLSIASRLSTLTVQMGLTAETVWRSVHGLLRYRDPIHSECCCGAPALPKAYRLDSPAEVDDAPSNVDPSKDGIYELGEVISRATHTKEESTTQSAATVHQETREMQVSDDDIMFAPEVPIILASSRMVDQPRETKEGRPSAPVAVQSKTRKSRRKQDEIDMIFG